MREAYIKKIIFITKSLLWSVVLYTTIILALDWKELKNNNDTVAVHEQHSVTSAEQVSATEDFKRKVKSAPTLLFIITKVGYYLTD